MLRNIVAIIAVVAVSQAEGAAKGGKIFKRGVGAAAQSNVVKKFSNAVNNFNYQPAQEQMYYQPIPPQRQSFQPQQQSPPQFIPQQNGYYQFVPYQRITDQQAQVLTAPQNLFSQVPVVQKNQNVFQLKPTFQRHNIQKPAQKPTAVRTPTAEKPIVQKIVEELAANKPVAKNTKTVPAVQSQVVDKVITSRPVNSQVIRATAVIDNRRVPILDRLPDNSTLIRTHISDTFSCNGRDYGYYADVDNDCQVFHLCFPLKQVFAEDPDVFSVPDVTYHFSFICNKYTIFSQDSLTCAWTREALPCSQAERYARTVDYEWFKTTQKP